MKKINKQKDLGRSDFDASIDYVHGRDIVVIDKFPTIIESIEKEEQSWFPKSQNPTDLTIQVDGFNFYLHKYILISRSEYISRFDFPPSTPNISYTLELENFPGGSETFEIVLKFCYGLPVDLTPENIASLRCASEYLQMTEEYEENNLISKTEAFLTFIVLSSWIETITVLQSCESLFPWAENLQIVRRCCDSIAWMVSRDQKLTTRDSINDERWWFHDVSTLNIDHFVRVITGIRVKGLKPETLGACITNYAEKWLTSIDIETLEEQREYGYCEKNELELSKENLEGNKAKRMMIESLLTILPPQKESVTCKFLLWMLKMAIVYSASPAMVSELEKRVGIVLEDANVVDLLIPSYTNADDQEKLGESPMGNNIKYDIDMVHRIVEYCLMHEQQQQQQQQKQLPKVAKLLDGYLAEIAKDPNLTIAKFQMLAETLTENARICHDGLYRAIDTYLKTHPELLEHDRRRLCKVMNCEKLSLDACTHAARNERLPLRIVMQVLFSEQVKMRKAIDEKEMIPSDTFTEQLTNLSSTKKEINTIKAELAKVRMVISELQHDYSNLQEEFQKLIITKQKNVSSWNTGWKKIKNSTFFHGKTEDIPLGEETPHRQVRRHSEGRRRRFSLS